MPSILGGDEVIADALVSGTPITGGVDEASQPPSKITTITSNKNGFLGLIQIPAKLWSQL